jgi:predicted transcriptional regulator
MPAREHIQFLAGSEYRVQLLSALQEPKRPGTLVDEQLASRATVQRALSGFTERGWVRKEIETGCYRLTTAGELVYDSYTELVGIVDRVEEAGESLSLLDCIEPNIPIEAVRTASMAVATPKTPHAAIDRYFNALENAESDIEYLYGMTPILSPVLNKAHEELVGSGVPTELIIDEETFEQIQSGETENTNDSLSIETFTLYVHPGSIGFGLGIVGERVFVGAYDSHGRSRANLDGTNDSLVEWAHTVYDKYKRESRLIEAI